MIRNAVWSDLCPDFTEVEKTLAYFDEQVSLKSGVNYIVVGKTLDEVKEGEIKTSPVTIAINRSDFFASDKYNLNGATLVNFKSFVDDFVFSLKNPEVIKFKIDNTIFLARLYRLHEFRSLDNPDIIGLKGLWFNIPNPRDVYPKEEEAILKPYILLRFDGTRAKLLTP